MNDLDDELRMRLEDLRQQNLLRELRRIDSPQGREVVIGGRTFINFASNDYLGLANHPALKEAARETLERFGCGSGASRLISGSLAPHHALEEALAAFKQTEAALVFSTGYATAIGTICALVGKDDVMVIDKLVHASIVDAAKLSGAKLRVFAHNDLDELEAILRWANERRGASTDRQSSTLIATESIFSMDGDAAPLRGLVALKERHGAWLMVDEAHATGLYGKRRSGLAEEVGVSGRIDVQMGTLGKALGTAGGYVCGSRVLVDYLVNRARSFIFSTAPPAATAAAAAAAVQLVQSDEGAQRCERLWSRVAELHSSGSRSGIGNSAAVRSAIVPVMIGDEACALDAAARLRDAGLFVPAVRYPTVARGRARLRISLSADHTSGDIARLVEALDAVVHSPASLISENAPARST